MNRECLTGNPSHSHGNPPWVVRGGQHSMDDRPRGLHHHGARPAAAGGRHHKPPVPLSGRV